MKLTGRLSPASGFHEMEVGHLFKLLCRGIEASTGVYFQAGQGDSPSEDEEEMMLASQREAEEIAKEIFLGLTGKKCKVINE